MNLRTEPIAGRYELIEPLESGGMGQVWRGYDSVLDREIAVKLIRPDLVTPHEVANEFVKRFRREARITARIQHHGVPQVFDAGLDEAADRVYLVMEFVRGASLRSFIDPRRPLPVSWAAAVVAQIATVLSHAHAIPVVHRDLKPANVMVTADGTVKVLDFGIAAVLRTDVTRLTSTGSPIGTTRYMSPEQIQAAQISPASDLYALGCVLHELLTGAPVFDGDNDFRLMHQHVAEPPPDLATLRPHVPPPLVALVRQMLAKVPQQRPVDAYEVYERLLPFLPAPGTPKPTGDSGPIGMPDPTLLYRRPNAPRPRVATPVGPVAAPTPPEPTRPSVPADVVAAINAAIAQSDALLADERYAQAAEAIFAVIGAAGAKLGPESPRVLRLRQRRAAILVVGGDYRRALPEFDGLAKAYQRTAGPASDDAVECARQAAYCRAEVGETTAALRQFEEVLAHVRAAKGDTDPVALDVRRSIALLLLSEGRTGEAASVLRPLYADLCAAYGPRHEDTQDVADMLARLRIPTEPTHADAPSPL